MSDIAVRVENLGKMYRIGGSQEKYATLRDALVSTATAPFRKVRGLLRGESASGLKEEIWALKDVSFEVKQGEVVGVIGRNGAGKSTLLKVLSRITEPTTGCAHIYGRVGALLEVGTGFHPELTGRENVYLNGAILGMTRHDIERKFDEIVAFAEVEKFIDTPVKYYSSGMGLRLGFAVAAHLEPEILIVDEVLAVGDAAFQSKCIGKMAEVADYGRTVLFVSHNMAAVANLTEKALVIQQGTIAHFGKTTEAIAAYIQVNEDQEQPFRPIHLTTKAGAIHILDASICDAHGNRSKAFLFGHDIRISLECYVERPQQVEFVFAFLNELGVRAFTLSSQHERGSELAIQGNVKIDCFVPNLRLVSGRYLIRLALYISGQKIYENDEFAHLTVASSDMFGSSKYHTSRHGIYIQRSEWHVY